MAKYERKILVPYLQDVCSMEMVCARVQRSIQDCNNRIRTLEVYIQNSANKPIAPSRKSGYGERANILNLLIILGCIALVVGVSALPYVGTFLAFVVAVPVILVGIIPSVIDIVGSKANYMDATEKYKRELCDFDNKQKKLPQYRNRLNEEKKQLSILKSQLVSAKMMRDNLYGVNVIPSKYRNIHAAYFLYDYFNSTRETDLDKIIQTMLLDEIIQKLDKIIAQNEEIILNQRMQLALQKQQNEMIAHNHREEMDRLARMERNQERQMDYQNMMVCNQKVTNFFLEADYLRKL